MVESLTLRPIAPGFVSRGLLPDHGGYMLSVLTSKTSFDLSCSFYIIYLSERKNSNLFGFQLALNVIHMAIVPSNNVVEVFMILESLDLKSTGFHMPRWTTIESLRVGTSINVIISVWRQYTTALLSTAMFLLPGGRRVKWRPWQPGNIFIPTFAISHLIHCPILESLRSLCGFTWPSR